LGQLIAMRRTASSTCWRVSAITTMRAAS
jgi:hypothetical protein